jgi:hypothetical protein
MEYSFALLHFLFHELFPQSAKMSAWCGGRVHLSVYFISETNLLNKHKSNWMLSVCAKFIQRIQFWFVSVQYKPCFAWSQIQMYAFFKTVASYTKAFIWNIFLRGEYSTKQNKKICSGSVQCDCMCDGNKRTSRPIRYQKIEGRIWKNACVSLEYSSLLMTLHCLFSGLEK